jgi:hypothetical protein
MAPWQFKNSSFSDSISTQMIFALTPAPCSFAGCWRLVQSKHSIAARTALATLAENIVSLTADIVRGQHNARRKGGHYRNPKTSDP